MVFTAASGNPAIPLLKTYTTVQSLQPLLKRLRNQTHRIVLYGLEGLRPKTLSEPSGGSKGQVSDINLFIVAPEPQRILAITDTFRIPGFGSVGGLRSSNRRTAGVASKIQDSSPPVLPATAQRPTIPVEFTPSPASGQPQPLTEPVLPALAPGVEHPVTLDLGTGAEQALGVPKGGTPASLAPTQSVFCLRPSLLHRLPPRVRPAL